MRGLRSPFRRPRRPFSPDETSGFVVSIGSGNVVTNTLLTASITPDPAPATPTYRWLDDDVAISGATSSTYTPQIGVDGVADASNIRAEVTIDGNVYLSGRRLLVYALGTAPSIADGQNWTVDDTAVSIDGSAAGANLTFSYSATGLPTGVSINPTTGLISGTPSVVSSGTATVTATDQYGRPYSDTFTWSSALRAQATAADGLGPFSWTVDSPVSVDATADFTDNGNELVYTATGLPTGITISVNGTISGTPTVVSSGTIVVTGTDEYGRETTSTTSHTTALRAQATAANGLGPYSWTVDDTEIPLIDFKPDFTVGDNTLTYVISGLPSGVSDNGDGTFGPGVASAAASGNIVCTGTDEYGRQTTSTAAFTAALRPQAAGGDDLDLSFTVGVPLASPVNLISQWTGAGGASVDENTLTFVSIAPALPSGLSVDSTGTIASGQTPSSVTADATYTLTMEDEYGRETSDTLTLEIAAASALPSSVVILGSSLIEDTFGRNLSVPNSQATTALSNAGYPGINVYGYGVSGLLMNSVSATIGEPTQSNFPNGFISALEDVRAVHPNAWIIVHLGGGNVTNLRPLADMTSQEVTDWNTDLAAMLNAAVSDGGTIYFGSLTFRDYGNTTFVDPSNGSKPFNQGAVTSLGGVVNGVIPSLATTVPRSIKTTGRPFFDFYRFILSDFESWLDPDNVHINTTGQAALRGYVIDTLADIFAGTEPTDIVEREASLSVAASGTGELQVTYDGGADDTLDSVTLTDPDGVFYWEGVWTTYADGSPLLLTQLDTIAAKALVLPTPTRTVDADSSSTTSVGDTVAISDYGVWLYTGDTAPTLSVAWYDSQGVIPGATSLSFVLTSDQAGENVYPVITATLAGKTNENSSLSGSALAVDGVGGSWSLTDNGNGTFDIASAPAAPGALTLTDNGDGTFNIA